MYNEPPNSIPMFVCRSCGYVGQLDDWGRSKHAEYCPHCQAVNLQRIGWRPETASQEPMSHA